MANIKPAKLGTFFALLTILMAFAMGAGMGLFEDEAKDFFKDEAYAARYTAYGVEPATTKPATPEAPKADAAKADDKEARVLTPKMEKAAADAWKYTKRTHYHSGGIGAVALGLCLMLGIVSRCGICKFLGSLCLGLGALGYSVFWGLAAWKAPTLGSTGAAKEMFEYVAMGGGGLCLFGLLLAFMAFFKGCCGSGCSLEDE